MMGWPAPCWRVKCSAIMVTDVSACTPPSFKISTQHMKTQYVQVWCDAELNVLLAYAMELVAMVLFFLYIYLCIYLQVDTPWPLGWPPDLVLHPHSDTLHTWCMWPLLFSSPPSKVAPPFPFPTWLELFSSSRAACWPLNSLTNKGPSYKFEGKRRVDGAAGRVH